MHSAYRKGKIIISFHFCLLFGELRFNAVSMQFFFHSKLFSFCLPRRYSVDNVARRCFVIFSSGCDLGLPALVFYLFTFQIFMTECSSSKSTCSLFKLPFRFEPMSSFNVAAFCSVQWGIEWINHDINGNARSTIVHIQLYRVCYVSKQCRVIMQMLMLCGSFEYFSSVIYFSSGKMNESSTFGSENCIHI